MCAFAERGAVLRYRRSISKVRSIIETSFYGYVDTVFDFFEWSYACKKGWFVIQKFFNKDSVLNLILCLDVKFTLP